MSFFMPISYRFCYYGSLVQFETSYYDILCIALSPEGCFGYCASFVQPHMKLGLLFFSISVNSVTEVLMGVVLNL